MNSTSVHCIVVPVGHNLTHMTEGPHAKAKCNINKEQYELPGD